MNKSLLLKHLMEELMAVQQVAIDSALRAYDTATHEENVAENKYDTLGLEAAYLAQGQARRVAECEADLTAFRDLTIADYTDQTPITVGAIIVLKDKSGTVQTFFLGPAAGGLKFKFEQKEIFVITPAAPLGQALLGSLLDDVVDMNVGGKKMHYEIIAIY
jgi:transcription elongation GreA/GreB family factor